MLHRMKNSKSVMQYSYGELARRIEREIRQGHYPVGARLPSVRECASGHGVSVSTAIRCYRHLESQGLVEARSKSGIYVADWKSRRKPDVGDLAGARKPSRAAPPQYEQLMSLPHRMTELYALTAQTLSLGLHLAHVAPQWYPCQALSDIGQRLLRKDPMAIGAYPTGTGLPAFKASLINWLGACGVDLGEHDLLVTHGSTEALNVALRSVAQPGDAVIVESPVYFGLLQMIDNLGLRAVEVPCVPGAGISLEALEFALEHQHGVRAVVVSAVFQNPLGCAMSDRDKRRLLKLAEQHDVAVIEDDAFGDLSPAVERPQPIKAWDRSQRVIYCGSCSKSLAPAFRVGWVAGGRYHARIETLKLSNSLVAPLFEQAVLAEWLNSGAHLLHLRRLRERLALNLPLALDAVARHFPAGTQVVSASGGWWLWLALPDHVDTLALLKRAVAQGIAFAPGVVFSSSTKFVNHLRINTGRPWGRDMERGFETLGALVQSAPVRVS